MPHNRFFAGLLVLALTVGCKAQISPSSGLTPTLIRRIDIMVRARYDLPPDATLSLGLRKPSSFADYDTLPITISDGGTSQIVNFLISHDNTKLVHLDTMNLSNDPAADINVAGRPIRGNPAAKVTVINFDDLECPFCARMNHELFPATLEHYQNQVRLIYMDYPLTQLHPWALHAAVDANCLAALNGDAYWDYVDYVHSHDGEITGQNLNLQKSFAALDRLASGEGSIYKLDQSRLDACIAKQDETGIKAEMKEGETLGIEGTPFLFVNGERIDGAVPQDQLWTVINRALRAVGEQPPAEPPAANTQQPATTGENAGSGKKAGP